MLKIPILTVKQIEANVAHSTARVGSIQSSNGFVLARRDQDGSINLLSQLIIPETRSVASPGPTNGASRAWAAKIDEIAFGNYAIRVEDKKPAKPAMLEMDNVGFTLRNVSDASNAPIAALLSMRLQKTGTLQVEGDANLFPPAADVRLAITNVDLRIAQPYLEDQIKLIVASGALDVEGRARYGAREPGVPAVSFNGTVAVNRFATTDDVLFKDFVKFDLYMALSGIDVTLQPDKMHVDELRFTGLDATALVGPDKRVNLQTILGKSGEPAAAAPAGAARDVPNASLGALVLGKCGDSFCRPIHRAALRVRYT